VRERANQSSKTMRQRVERSARTSTCFVVQSSVFWVESLEFRVEGLGLRVEVAGCRV
jgi:hypothetical protein